MFVYIGENPIHFIYIFTDCRSVYCINFNGHLQVTLRIKRVTFSKPMVNEKNSFSRQLLVYPSECREGGTTYQGNLEIDVSWFFCTCFVKFR